MTGPGHADALAAAADALRLAAEALEAAATAARRDGREADRLPAGYVSLDEAARAFGLSRSGLGAAIARGEIASRKIGRRRMVPKAEVDRLSAPTTA
jgi:excisionase family DNA binding protein